MNNLSNIQKLNNRYFLMRHGQSVANVKRLIVSHYSNGSSSDYALTELGVNQVKQSVNKLFLDKKLIIYCSDFARTAHTAQIVGELLKTSDIHTTELLRERFFGDFEMANNDNYQKVWKLDKDSSRHTVFNVESVDDVLGRATRLILEIEANHENRDVLLISHGDTLQILQTGFMKIDPTRHRELPHLETAEIRQISLNGM